MVVALHAEFTVKPGAEARVAEMVRTLGTHVRAEPGNLEFVPFTEKSNPRHYFVYEIYRDENAFTAHISADYGTVFNAELGSLIEEDGSQLMFLEPLGET
jgi:quinol monooxygenase YgiN